ncbi:MAG: hypothetical protein AB1918_03315 [Pseudomonadota bacterium]
MMGTSEAVELAIANRMLEEGDPGAAYTLAVGVLHSAGGRYCDDARDSWDKAHALARRALLQPRTHLA